jgi:hypothetical protein
MVATETPNYFENFGNSGPSAAALPNLCYPSDGRDGLAEYLEESPQGQGASASPNGNTLWGEIVRFDLAANFPYRIVVALILGV